VTGWLGGNVLKNFRLTIDYPDQTIYWLQQTEPDPHDLDQVGLTLKFEQGNYLVAGVATKNGKPTVDDVQPGDRLVRIDTLETKGAPWGAIYDAMHGSPGEVRTLTLDRAADQITVRARISSF
jgi:C-terminal processing protease CtpA/Prc